MKTKNFKSELVLVIIMASVIGMRKLVFIRIKSDDCTYRNV